MHAYETWSEERVAEVIAAHADQAGPAIPIFHALQETFGYVPEEAVGMVAEVLNLSRAETYGVLTFYHDFRHEPAGRHVVKLCRAEACQSMGAEAVAEHAQKKLGVKWGQTTTDGNVTLEPVYCLGLCACAPSAMVDGRVVGRVDKSRLDALLAGLKQ